MGIQDFEKYNARLTHARRGRPRVASDDVRENQYRDEEGTYVLSNGLKPWHIRIVDFMLLNPNSKIVDVAKAFDVTPQWIGQLMKTDAFKDYFHNIISEHQGVVSEMVINKLQGVAIKALDKMDEQLDKPDASFGMARDAATLALKGAGFGESSTSVQAGIKSANGDIVSVSVTKGVVDKARARIHERAKENSERLGHDPSNYTHVTSALEVTGEDEVEDAIIVSDGNSSEAS